MIADIIFTPLKIIPTPGGSVQHAMKKSDEGFSGYGEAYFSVCETGVVKAWKLHKEMTLNLIVPVGSIRFVVFDPCESFESQGTFNEFVLSPSNYGRLTIPPKLWMGFQGLSNGGNILLNIANLEHDPDEVERKPLDQIEFDWSIKR
ncbi:MAG: dTDP-4-dehydrorhamnose 3,5-epimerase [Paracoccaceae bacterium]|nr:dTDP-4-dehydrorhamnose 3,5-epimerase [Paracoccaceae bacterium]MDG2258386.1 dTDP-4-dehydrorhamnose 3,5-epimerase [Paracoccaceae bacterium]